MFAKYFFFYCKAFGKVYSTSQSFIAIKFIFLPANSNGIVKKMIESFAKYSKDLNRGGYIRPNPEDRINETQRTENEKPYDQPGGPNMTIGPKVYVL